jgi:hypothetical protein
MKVEVGDVVYAAGSSAILGDVREVDDDGHAVVDWRPVRTTEQTDDLIVEQKSTYRGLERAEYRISKLERTMLELVREVKARVSTVEQAVLELAEERRVDVDA